MSAPAQMFVASVLCGAASVLLWDLLHGLRTVVFKGVIFNILLDGLWWLCIGAGFIYCMWYYTFMNLRFYVFFGALAGAFLYHITLSKWLRLSFCKIFEIFYKIIRFIFKILLTPAAFLYKILIVGFMGNIMNKVRRRNLK